MEALYIHIPFCSKVCTYCDFYKMVAKKALKTKYIEYLIKELEMKKKYLVNIKTIYIGGGTPSSLDLNLLDYLFYHLNRLIDFNNIIEFTIEANPLDVTLDFVKLIKKYNVNRISLGVQTFNENKLKFLGRDHTKKDIKKAVKNLKRFKLTNINFDFIYATPNDTFNSIKKDLISAINMGIKHISTYSLILEEKTILYKKYLNNEFVLFNEDIEYKIYHKIRKFLNSNGFYQYEISNFALKNHQSIHNLTYWNNNKYLGIGAGASYYIDNVRYTNIMNLEQYFKGIDDKKLIYKEKNILTEFDQMQEEMILGLRKTSGISIEDFENKYFVDIFEAFPVIKSLLDKKLLKIKKNKIFIPEDKLYLSNAIMENFI